jgi:hypothetical protein
MAPSGWRPSAPLLLLPVPLQVPNLTNVAKLFGCARTVIVGGAVVTAVQLVYGVKLQPLQALGAAFALLIGWFVVKSFFTSLAALLLPVKVVKGELQHANKVTHDGIGASGAMVVIQWLAETN